MAIKDKIPKSLTEAQLNTPENIEKLLQDTVSKLVKTTLEQPTMADILRKRQ